MKVKVYWNSHKKLFSIVHKGKVIAHKKVVFLSDCKFVVNQKGREKVLQQKKKNVHAYIYGTLADPEELVRNDVEPLNVRYNPYYNSSFMTESGPIFEAKQVDLVSIEIIGTFIHAYV